MLKILFFVVLIAAFNYFMYPPVWRKCSKRLRIVLPVAHLIGIVSLVLLGYAYHGIPDGFFRNLIRTVETVYFSMIALSGTCFLLYLPVLLIASRKSGKTARILSNRGLVVWIVSIFCLIITIIGMYRIDHIHLTSYTIHSDKMCRDSAVRIAAIGDTHLGAGADRDTVDSMVDAINAMEADVLLMLGDLTDETTSQQDIEYFTEALKNIVTKYGIYSVTGNHEVKCRTDIVPYLEDAGVQIIDGEAVELPNGLVLVGQVIYSTTSVDEVLEHSGVSAEGKPVVILRHDPREFDLYDGHADAIFCGHTHGLRYPMVAISQAYYFDMSYGMELWPKGMHAITTSGVSAWGFHFKWPAISEVVQLDMTFGG